MMRSLWGHEAKFCVIYNDDEGVEHRDYYKRREEAEQHGKDMDEMGMFAPIVVEVLRIQD